MTIEPTCNLAYTELRHMELVDRKTLVERKLYIGHGGLSWQVGWSHFSHYQTPTVSYFLVQLVWLEVEST